MNKITLTKKLFVFFLIFVFLFSLAEVSVAENTVSVALTDNYVGHSTAYHITFQSNAQIDKGETIAIIFDDKIPIFRNGELAERITVNGEALSEAPLFLGHEIDIESPLSIGENSKTEITIPKGILQNPNTSGYFTLSIKVGKSTYQSEYYKITDKDTVKDVLLSKDLSKNGSNLIITFRTGFDGALKGYETKAVNAGHFTIVQPIPKDFIFIRFSHIVSEGIFAISKNDVTVNGKTPPVNPTIKTHFEGTDREEKEIAIVVPENINANSMVKVVLKGITLPDKEGGIMQARVWTSKEFTPVSSNAVRVESPYLLKTTCTVTPQTPDGGNGFYKSAPNVCLTAESGTLITKAETFYSLDGENFVKYEKPFVLPDGDDTLFYYSVGYLKNGAKITEHVHKQSFLVDTTPPEIYITSENKTDSPMYMLTFKVEDANFDYAEVEADGITFVFTDKEAELPLYIFGGRISVKITAFDRAGNKAEKVFTVSLSGK